MPLYLKVVLPITGLILGIFSLTVPEGARSQSPTNEAPPDAIAQAQTPKEAPVERPEQKKTAHDLSDVFNPSNAVPSSEALTNQTDRGQMNGFDFYRDPLGAMRPGMTFESTIWLSSCGSCRACGLRRRARRRHAHIVRSAAMIDQVMFHAAHGRGAARFSAACFFATLMLVAAAPFVSAQTNSCGGDNGGITLPPGFCATIFADNLGHARQMAFGPNGVLYLNTWSGGYYQNDKPPDGGFLVALKDTKGDGRADVMARFGDGVAQGSAGGTGIRIYNGGLFAEQNDKIIRYPLPANGFVPGEQPRVIVSGLPLTGDHPMHPFIIDAEGHLFVDLGSTTNSCQKENRIANSPGYQPCIELQTRAGTWLYDANKENQRFSPEERYVTGLRNGEGFAFDSAGRLFATMHGRDQLSQNWPSLFTADQSAQLPAEEIVQLEKGADFGWPECYYDGIQKKLVLAPEYGGDGKKIGVCADKKAPVASFPGHWAPNDLLIYSGNAFPAAHQGGAFVAFHGSWN